MATKIVRRTLIQFGTTINPASEIGQFGSWSSPDFSFDVGVMQSGTAWPRGWFGSVADTNRQFIQDQNAMDFVFGYMLSYILQMGMAEYDAGTIYFLNSVCQIAGQFYISLQDNNTGNPPGTSPTFWQPGLPGVEVTGTIKDYAGLVAPSGYLICNGQAVSRTTYAALFTVCGVAFGAGDGVITFNVPDCRGKVRVPYLSGDPNFGTVGTPGGEAAHTLNIGEMPPHTHPQDPNTILGIASSRPFGAGNPAATGGTTGSAGGGLPHNNLQPFVTIGCAIIKT